MNLAAPDLAQTYLAIPVGALFFLAPGYVLAGVSNFYDFKTRSGREQVLWSVALSVPISLTLAQILGRLSSAPWTPICFLLIAMMAGTIALRHGALERIFARSAWSGSTGKALAICLGLAVILPLATADIQVGHRLFQSTVIYDWAVRVPMVRAAMEGGVPPVNPLSALHAGQATPLRYYYFWYVLVAQLCHVAHVSARAGLAASTVWAAFDFIAVLFLSLKHLASVKHRLQSTCLVALVVACVMGLDLIPALLMLLLPGVGVSIEMEWWHPDRSPSWLATFQYAPHHIAGLSCCVVGLMAILTCAEGRGLERERSRFEWVRLSFIAGICFAAAAGTSTFMTLTFMVVCLLWALRAAIKREWITIGALALAAVYAFVFTQSFLREMTAPVSGVSGGGSSILHLALRNNEFVAFTFAKHHLLQNHLLLNLAARAPGILLLLFAEFGFFAFVFVHQLRRDAPHRHRLSLGEQAVWTIFCGAGLVALFVSSGSNGPNDLGMHAGAIVKFALLLWAAPWVLEMYGRRHEFAQLSSLRRLMVATVAGTFALGLAGSFYQFAMERSLFPLHEAGLVRKHMDTYPVTGLSYRLYDVRDAWQNAAILLPKSAVVMMNPDSKLQPALDVYATRQLAAADPKCGTPFGGDESRCKQLYPEIAAIYSEGANGGQFDTLCSELGLEAIVTTSTDGAWSDPRSWVWTRTPLYANSTVRILPCAAGSATPLH